MRIILALVLVIIILLVATIALITCIIPSSDTDKDRLYYNTLLSDSVNNVKTGDLVLFKNGINYPINTILGSEQFSHSGLIVVINNKPYIYELVENVLGNYIYHKEFRTSNSDVQLAPMYDRIKYYAGDCYIASLTSELTPVQIEKLLKFIENNKNHRFVNYRKWLPFLWSNRTLKNESFCHEFIAKVLNEVGISDKPINEKKIHLTRKLVNLCDGMTYSIPVRIIPNELLLKNRINFNKLPKLTYYNNLIHSDRLINHL